MNIRNQANRELPAPLEQRLAAIWPPEAWADVTVLVAVSGGADSVALVRGLNSIRTFGRGRLVVGHLNHRLRGDESDAEERFVAELSDELGLECCRDRLEPGSLAVPGDGLEAAARAVRHRFFRMTAERVGARYVACGHTADDQIETVLHRILRGTGIGGLAGIPRTRCLSDAVTLIRPLLGVRRTALIDYLRRIGQSYRNDTSNRDLRFTRNRLRHELLPQLAEHYNPAVGEALLRLGRLAGEVQGVVDALVEGLLARAVVGEADGLVISRCAVAGESEYVVRELLMAAWRRRGWPLRSMGFEEWDRLVGMVLGPGMPGTAVAKKWVFPGQVAAEVREEGLALRRG